jgi:lipid II:glycine glycyltransferase (peptidoglycan interpeptide bridge formation enzyme)
LIKHRLPFGKSWLYSPRLNFPADYFFQLIDAIAAIAKGENSIFWKIEFKNNTLISNIQYPISLSNPLQPRETFLINLNQTDDQLLKSMKPKTRYNIKLAQKKGVTARWSKGIADIGVFYNLLLKTSARQKIKLHPKAHYQNILKILGKEDAAALIIAEFKGKVIAANLITFYGDTAIYLHGGTDGANREVMAPHLLQWEAILKAKQRKCKFYDLGGCAVKFGKVGEWAGITRFKSGFGGELAQFGQTYDVIFKKACYWVYQSVACLKSWL